MRTRHLQFSDQLLIVRDRNQPVHERLVAVPVITKRTCLHRQNVGKGIELQHSVKCRRAIALILEFGGLDFNQLVADPGGVFGTADLRQSLVHLLRCWQRLIRLRHSLQGR